MAENQVAKFAVKKLKQYAHENGVSPRSTSDLSPLEQWLIIQLFHHRLPTKSFKTNTK